MQRGSLVAALALVSLSWIAQSGAAVLNVPADHASIQQALDQAGAGDTVRVCESGGPYHEKIVFPASGSAMDGFITLEACPGERPVLDGSGVVGEHMVLIDGKSYVRIRGFEIRDHLDVNDGSGVRVSGSGSHIEILDNEIHEIRGQHAMGITVYATEPDPIDQIVIDGNEIHDCEPYSSEALVLNGNVTNFTVTNNIVRDVNNIGIDFIGGETDINPNPALVARHGICAGNTVIRANQQGGGFAAGIYVDGGRDIIIERNTVTESDLGIEIGAENGGTTTTNITVRNNFVYANHKVGIVFGGYRKTAGRVRDSSFTNNTTFGNDTLGTGFGELWIQYADQNSVRNNIFAGTGQGPITYSGKGNTANDLDYNLWFSPAAGATEFVWRDVSYSGFPAYQGGTSLDSGGLFANPQLLDPGVGDLHLNAISPAIDAGDPGFADAAAVDIDGEPRLNGVRVDIGADEKPLCGDGAVAISEECDDGDLDDGDGCDSNCTTTACGNGITTAGEACDDGNVSAGDCCGPTCEFDVAGSACDDGEPCSHTDACDGAGTCAGSFTPSPSCSGATESGASKIRLKDCSTDTCDQVRLGLRRGVASTTADFEDPTAATNYALCVYDANGLVTGPRAPAGGKWSAAGDGFRYRDSARSPDGVQSVRLKPGSAGSTKVDFKAKGTNLALPPLGLVPPVTAQVRHDDGGCWGAVFSTPQTNEPQAFKARSD